MERGRCFRGCCLLDRRRLHLRCLRESVSSERAVQKKASIWISPIHESRSCSLDESCGSSSLPCSASSDQPSGYFRDESSRASDDHPRTCVFDEYSSALELSRKNSTDAKSWSG